MTRTSDSCRALASDSRVELLHTLQRSDTPLSLIELADAVGLHLNTVREHLDRLVAAGFVASAPEHRAVRGRPRLLYRAVDREAGASLDARLRDRLLDVLVGGFRPEVAEVLGDATGQVAALEMHLDDLDMHPELELDPLRIHLRHCPFAALARERPEQVCSVHLQLVRGVLARHSGPVVAERLEPFVGPDHCVLHLNAGAAGEPQVAAAP